MGEIANKLADKLAAEGDKTLLFFHALDDPDWSVTVYTDGALWSVRDILAHFVVSEVGILKLIRNVLDGGIGASEDFDLDRYNRSKVSGLETLPIPNLLEKFADLRGQSVRFVSGLADENLSLVGRHPWLGKTTIEEMLKLMYRHNQIHQRDIRHMLSIVNSESSP